MSLGASLGCFVGFAGIYFSEKITANRAAVLCRIWYVTRGISSLLCSSLVRKSSMFLISNSERTKLSQNKMLQRHLGCLTLLCIWVTRSFLYSPSIISAWFSVLKGQNYRQKKTQLFFAYGMSLGTSLGCFVKLAGPYLSLPCLTLLCMGVTRSFLYSPSIISAWFSVRKGQNYRKKKKRGCSVLHIVCH